jgi:hypothetical protein
MFRGLWLVVGGLWSVVGGLLLVVSAMAHGPATPIRPDFTDLSLGVLVTTATSGKLLKEPAAFESQFLKPWRAYLDTVNATLKMSEPAAEWNGPTPPPSVTWQCAAPIREAWNITDADVKAQLINALKEYHALVWSGGEASPLTIDCQILNMGMPLQDPGEAFTEVQIKKIPSEGTPSIVQIVLIYD